MGQPGRFLDILEPILDIEGRVEARLERSVRMVRGGPGDAWIEIASRTRDVLLPIRSLVESSIYLGSGR